MQWSSFFDGKLQTNYGAGEFVPVDRWHGFLWLFIAGVPWAGLGACTLAWCAPLRRTRAWHWALRLGLGIGGWLLASALYRHFPQYFLPLYETLADRYQDVERNPNLRRLTNDCGAAIQHLGLYLGFLVYEILRRDGKNVVLIATVGLVNGVGWAALQNWKWAPGIWPSANFNWWRCWESSGGISIGIAYGLAYFLVNRPMSDAEQRAIEQRRSISGPSLEWLVVYLLLLVPPGFFLYYHAGRWGSLLVAALVLFGIVFLLVRRPKNPSIRGRPEGDPNLERFGLAVGVLFGLGLSLRNGLKGWFNIYRGDEAYWSMTLWRIFGPGILFGLILICGWILLRPMSRHFRGDLFPHAAWVMGLVLIVQNGIAQLVTGPLQHWNEAVFSIYYVLLFLTSAVIIIHYRSRESAQAPFELNA
jgi:hypothetical protein